jgi:hypothetical protein
MGCRKKLNLVDFSLSYFFEKEVGRKHLLQYKKADLRNFSKYEI